MDCKTFLNCRFISKKNLGGGNNGCLPSIETAGVIIPGSTVTDDFVMQVSIAKFKTARLIMVEYSTQ